MCSVSMCCSKKIYFVLLFVFNLLLKKCLGTIFYFSLCISLRIHVEYHVIVCFFNIRYPLCLLSFHVVVYYCLIWFTVFASCSCSFVIICSYFKQLVIFYCTFFSRRIRFCISFQPFWDHQGYIRKQLHTAINTCKSIFADRFALLVLLVFCLEFQFLLFYY